MTLTKKKMVSEIGRRTRLKNRDVQVMVESLTEVWAEELIRGGRIELENFLVLEVKRIDRGEKPGQLNSIVAPRIIRRIIVHTSKMLKQKLNSSFRLYRI